MAIWFVSLFLSSFKKSAMLFLIQSVNLDILLKASAILLVSWSAVGEDKLDEPKLDRSRAKKRLRTWNAKIYFVISEARWVRNVFEISPLHLLKDYFLDTHHKIANDDCSQEERYTRHVSDQHAVPHALYPFSAQHSEHNHETVHEICEVPSR